MAVIYCTLTIIYFMYLTADSAACVIHDDTYVRTFVISTLYMQACMHMNIRMYVRMDSHSALDNHAYLRTYVVVVVHVSTTNASCTVMISTLFSCIHAYVHSYTHIRTYVVTRQWTITQA